MLPLVQQIFSGIYYLQIVKATITQLIFSDHISRTPYCDLLF